MQQYLKSLIEEYQNVLIYMELAGYHLTEEAGEYFLKKGSEIVPMQFHSNGENPVLLFQFQKEQITLQKEKRRHSFSIKNGEDVMAKITYKGVGDIDILVQKEDASKYTLSLSASSYAFSYDGQDKTHVAAHGTLTGAKTNDVIRYFEIIAKIEEDIIFASIEKTPMIHMILFRGDIMKKGGKFEPFVTIKKRYGKNFLPSDWVDAVLFPKEGISYFAQTIAEIEKIFPGFTCYMRTYHPTFACIYPEDIKNIEESFLYQVWPHVVDNIKAKLPKKEAPSVQTLQLSYAEDKS